ncbi:hypothetical protein CEXT_149941 [Caerostris extrusa]|uniref:DH domain-containing protein n=1 Tax=Caerostris extrusa TaxID=172846 RepID=A0AAV4NG42_CAEEX|nr:hypothetical protein CEXT_149941 [Caerostris extrusa]
MGQCVRGRAYAGVGVGCAPSGGTPTPGTPSVHGRERGARRLLGPRRPPGWRAPAPARGPTSWDTRSATDVRLRVVEELLSSEKDYCHTLKLSPIYMKNHSGNLYYCND